MANTTLALNAQSARFPQVNVFFDAAARRARHYWMPAAHGATPIKVGEAAKVQQYEAELERVQADKQAATILNFWRARGGSNVAAWVIHEPRGGFCVRSNLVGGLPPIKAGAPLNG